MLGDRTGSRQSFSTTKMALDQHSYAAGLGAMGRLVQARTWLEPKNISLSPRHELEKWFEAKTRHEKTQS